MFFFLLIEFLRLHNRQQNVNSNKTIKIQLCWTEYFLSENTVTGLQKISVSFSLWLSFVSTKIFPCVSLLRQDVCGGPLSNAFYPLLMYLSSLNCQPDLAQIAWCLYLREHFCHSQLCSPVLFCGFFLHKQINYG